MNYAFRNGKILDGTKEMKVQQGLCILVENGIITDLIPDANADLHNYKVIDLHGQYILPGLINMHVHLDACSSCWKRKASEKAAQ